MCSMRSECLVRRSAVCTCSTAAVVYVSSRLVGKLCINGRAGERILVDLTDEFRGDTHRSMNKTTRLLRARDSDSRCCYLLFCHDHLVLCVNLFGGACVWVAGGLDDAQE